MGCCTPRHLRDSVVLFTLYLAANFLYEGCFPCSCDSNSATASSIAVMVVELLRVEVCVNYRTCCGVWVARFTERLAWAICTVS
jgi:hypothetical protein